MVVARARIVAEVAAVLGIGLVENNYYDLAEQFGVEMKISVVKQQRLTEAAAYLL